MRDKKLDRLFLRFRTRGDTAALGEVFDASAPELLRVAMSLVADPGEADDLLQATYLTAIERADKWDASRRLVPWLLGILVHHAHDLRRKRGRAVEPDRLDERVGENPLDEATRAELTDTLRKTLAGLPAHYREVLQPFVVGGEKPADIAARLGRPPGTVRMQIHRGLDLLRKGLPAGFALGVLASTAGRGLAAVRAEVLAHGSAQAGALLGATGAAGAGTSMSWTLGGITVSKKIALVAAALVVVGSLAWVAQLAADTPAAGAGGALSGAGLEGPALSAHRAPGDDAGALLGADAAAPDARVEGARRDTRVVRSEPSLASVVGRVVEADGRPVAGIPVVLYELGLEMLAVSPRAGFDERAPRQLVRARARTDEDGSFRFTGARTAALHGVGVDPGGERPLLRLVDESLVPAAETRLSDIVLQPVVPLTGRVVDAEGAPVAGARVRAGNLPSYVEWDVWAPIAAGMPVWVRNKPIQLVVTAPPELAQVEALLPFPTAYTDADGVFTLAGAPAGETSVVVDHPGYVPLVRAAGEPVDGARDLGALALEPGLVLAGRVVDDDGQAVVGADVRAGASASIGWGGDPTVAPLAATATTDAGGNFRLAGIPTGRSLVVLATRRSAAHPWTARIIEDEGVQTLKLPGETTAAVRVETADGAPVSGAQLEVGRPGLLGAILSGGALLDPREPLGRVEELGDGRYAVHGLQRGSYVLRVDAVGHALGEERLRVKPRMDELVVQLAPARERAVRVVDALSGAALEGARVELLAGGGGALLAEALTDAEGRARLAGTPVTLREGAHLRVDHPAYGARQVEAVLEDAESLVELAPAGTVVARVRWSGGQTVAPMMLQLDEPTGGAYPDFLARRLGVTDAEGEIRLPVVAPGPWRWRLYERYLDEDVIDLVSGVKWPRVVEAGTIDVAPGAETVLDIELVPDSESTLPVGTARLQGRVTLDDVPAQDATITVRMLDGDVQGRAETEVLPDGSYLLEGLPAGEAQVSVSQSETNGPMTWTFTVDKDKTVLEAGRTRELDFVWREARVTVIVEDEDGAPVTGVGVRPRSERISAWTWFETDDEGRTEVRVRRPGPVKLTVDEDDHGVASLEVELAEGENEQVTLVLDPGAPFGGKVRVPAGFPKDAGQQASLRVSATSGEARKWLILGLSGGEAAFHVLGLPAGSYTAELHLPDQEFETHEFELPAAGRTDFEFAFVPIEKQ